MCYMYILWELNIFASKYYYYFNVYFVRLIINRRLNFTFDLAIFCMTKEQKPHMELH